MKKNVTICTLSALICMFFLGHVSNAKEVQSLLDLTSAYIATHISFKKKTMAHLTESTHSLPNIIKRQMAKTFLNEYAKKNRVFDPKAHLEIANDKVYNIAYADDYIDVYYKKKLPHVNKDPMYVTDNIRTLFHLKNNRFNPVYEYYDATEDETTCFALNEKYVLIGDYCVFTVLNRNHEILRSSEWKYSINNIVPIKNSEQAFYLIEDSDGVMGKYDVNSNTFFDIPLKIDGIVDMQVIDSGRHTIIYDRYYDCERCRSCYIGCNDAKTFPDFNPLFSQVNHVCISNDAKYAACIMNFTKEQCMLKIIDLESLKIDHAMKLHEITLCHNLSHKSKSFFLSEHLGENVLAVGDGQRINLFKCPEGKLVFSMELPFTINTMHANKKNLFIEDDKRSIYRYPFWLLHSLSDYVQ